MPALSVALIGAVLAYSYLRVDGAFEKPAPVPMKPSEPVVRAAADPEAALDESERKAVVARLSPPGPVWIVFDPRHPALGRSLRAAFEEAGWTVKAFDAATFPLKPGVVVLSPDTEAPDEAKSVVAALAAAAITASVGTEYRRFYEETRAAKPDFRGFVFAPGQTYLVVVGRRGGPSGP